MLMGSGLWGLRILCVCAAALPRGCKGGAPAVTCWHSVKGPPRPTTHPRPTPTITYTTQELHDALARSTPKLQRAAVTYSGHTEVVFRVSYMARSKEGRQEG